MNSKPIKHTDNPRYTQDESGQWWYQANGCKRTGRQAGRPHPRIRAYVKSCAICGQEFLWQARTSHNATQNRGTFCSIQCANKSPTKFQGAPKGEKHVNWNGGRSRTADGYINIRMPDHPACQGNTRKYVLEHRLVMEEHLGRYLWPDENVHHVNGIRDDNRLANLELWSRSQPYGQRVEDKVSWAIELLKRYKPEALAA